MGVRDLFFRLTATDETGAAFASVKKHLQGIDDAVSRAQDRLTRWGGGLAKIGAGISAVMAPAILAFSGSVQAFDDSAKAAAKVEQAIKSTGGAAGFAAAQLFEVAAGLQDVTRFDGDEILNKVTAQLLTFTNIAGSEFLRAQTAALDLATVLDGDLQSASIMLGKALNDPVKGLSALGKAGIQFSEQQKEVIKSLAEAGDLAAAQQIILAELERQYGGQAEAAARAGVGALDQLRNAWGDVVETVGGVIASILPPVVDFFKTMVDGFLGLPEPMQRLIVSLGLVAAALGPVLIAAGATAIALGSISLPILAVIGLVAGAVALFIAFSDEITAFGHDVAAAFFDIKASVAESLDGAISSVIDFANATANTFEGAVGAIKAYWSLLPAAIGDLVMRAANNVVDGVESLLQGVADRINSWIDGINTVLEYASLDPIQLIPEVQLGDIPNQFANAANDAAAAAKGAFSAAFNDNPLEAPDLGLGQIATDARASADAIRAARPETDGLDASLSAVGETISGVSDSVDDLTSGLNGSEVAAGNLGSAATAATPGVAGLGGAAEKAADAFDGLGDDISRTLGDMVGDASGNMSSLSDVLLSIGQNMRDRLLKLVFDPIGQAAEELFRSILSGAGGGGGLFGGIGKAIGGFFGSIFGGLPGFDTGGEFVASGRNGVDRNVAAFRVSAGEKVSITRAGQSSGGSPVYVTIQTPNPAAFKASQGQTSAMIARAVARGSRNT